jgi:TRAP transporter TAXI family solute receptor
MNRQPALVMGTGRAGGDYTIYGPAWGRLIDAVPGMSVAYLSSGGASANILLIEEGNAQLGLTTVPVAVEALKGSEAWTGGVSLTSFRALFPTFSSVLQIVSPRPTGITTLAGLAGQVIGIGPDGGSGAATIPAIFSTVGVIPSRTVTGDFPSLVQAMCAGHIAACAFIGAPPLPAIAQAAMHQQFSLIGFSQAEAAQVARSLPGMTAAVLPAGTFPGQSIAVGSVGCANIAIGAATLSEAQAQAVTLAALRNQAKLAAAVPAALNIPDIAPIGGLGIGFHPGAADALRQYGYAVPDRFIAA